VEVDGRCQYKNGGNVEATVGMRVGGSCMEVYITRLV
jgi:hypothetical protein